MVKILKYDSPDHKIKLKIRQFQVMGKSTGQINNIGHKHMDCDNFIFSSFPSFQARKSSFDEHLWFL